MDTEEADEDGVDTAAKHRNCGAQSHWYTEAAGFAKCREIYVTLVARKVGIQPRNFGQFQKNVAKLKFVATRGAYRNF